MANHEAAIRQYLTKLISIASGDFRSCTNDHQWYLEIANSQSCGTNHATIAVILCMAINVEEINLRYAHGDADNTVKRSLATN